MKRFCELFLIPRNHLRFKSKNKLFKYALHPKYQIIDFYWEKAKNKEKLPLSISFRPLMFEALYEELLNKNKVILINGNYKDLKYYYHFLRFKEYKVYLVK